MTIVRFQLNSIIIKITIGMPTAAGATVEGCMRSLGQSSSGSKAWLAVPRTELPVQSAFSARLELELQCELDNSSNGNGDCETLEARATASA